MWPVPAQYPISTPYGKRGKWWSCDKNAQGGVHTGADFAAPNGTTVFAARGGTVKHTSYGTAFGSKQFAILCADGTEDFYAHTTTRPANGAKVTTGQAVAKVGAEGNVTGPHLHFERHPRQGSWSCSNHVNPQPSIDYQGATMADAWEYHYGNKPSGTLTVGTSYTRLDASTWNPKAAGVEFSMVYLNVKPTFKSGKTRGALRIRAVRADGDKSSYHDYVLDVDCVDSDGAQLITHVYFEKGDGGATYYELKCIGGLASVVVGTRYRKGAVDV